MSCTINSDGSSTCCAPGGPCSTSSAPIGIPAPINDYRPTDTISKQFGNTCGPFPDNGACGEALTSFQGVITNNTSEDADGSTLFEVSWNMGPGTPTYPVFSYEHPNNIFLVNRGRYQPVNWAGMSDEDITQSWKNSQDLCKATEVRMTIEEALAMGYTHRKEDGSIADRTLPMQRQLDSPECQTLIAIEKENIKRGINQSKSSFGILPNPFPKIKVIDTTGTKTAGLGGSNIAMILIVGGFIYYAYSKGLLKK